MTPCKCVPIILFLALVHAIVVQPQPAPTNPCCMDPDDLIVNTSYSHVGHFYGRRFPTAGAFDMVFGSSSGIEGKEHYENFLDQMGILTLNVGSNTGGNGDDLAAFRRHMADLFRLADLSINLAGEDTATEEMLFHLGSMFTFDQGNHQGTSQSMAEWFFEHYLPTEICGYDTNAWDHCMGDVFDDIKTGF